MQIFLFGNFQVYTDADTELALRPTAARLFAFLLLHRHTTHLREVVAETFWHSSEIDRARRNLNTTLWQLRKAFRQPDDREANVIAATPEQIKLNRETTLWLDIASFEEKAKQGLAGTNAGSHLTAVKTLEEAVNLYQGDLLHGFYDSWVLQERERLRLIYLRCLRRLMTVHQQQGNLDASIDYARRILRVEPWREDIHRTLMLLYAQNGRRAEAIVQYQTCRQALASELAVQPMAETESLYQRLLTNSQGDGFTAVVPVHPSLQDSSCAKPLTLQEATLQLQAAMQALRDAQNELNRAVAVVERLSQSA